MISPFASLLGNEQIKQQLSDSVAKQAIGQALLFAGPSGIGKSLFARALASLLLMQGKAENVEAQIQKLQKGQHPDFHLYRPEGKLGLHTIQSLRQLSEEVSLPPYEAEWKVFVIEQADRMLSYSANALLKTLEEPPPRTLIILLARSPTSLIPTLLSRCCKIHFQPIATPLIENYLRQHYPSDKILYANLAHRAQGSLGRAIQLVEQGDQQREEILQLFVQGPLENYRTLQEVAQKLSGQIEGSQKQIEEATKKVQQQWMGESISAQQQLFLGKEVEGQVALTLLQETRQLFNYILSWYRDLQLLLLGGTKAQLTNLDFYEALEQAVQRGDFLPLNVVYKAIEEADLALQRSTSLPLCLENLFLKLNRIRLA